MKMNRRKKGEPRTWAELREAVAGMIAAIDYQRHHDQRWQEFLEKLEKSRKEDEERERKKEEENGTEAGND